MCSELVLLLSVNTLLALMVLCRVDILLGHRINRDATRVAEIRLNCVICDKFCALTSSVETDI